MLSMAVVDTVDLSTLKQDGRGGKDDLLPLSTLLRHSVEEYTRWARSAAAKRPGTISQQGMYCQTQFSLQILNNGKVNGTKLYSDKFTVLNFIPIGMGKVYIQGVASDRYLCMGLDGRLYGSLKVSDECIMLEQLDPLRMYTTYSSFKYTSGRRKWYVALSKLGKARRGNKSRKRQKSIRFIRYMPNYERTRFKHKPVGSGSRSKVDNDVRRRRAKERKKRRRLKTNQK